MKCLIKHCEKERAHGYEACSSLHGMMLKRARESLSDLARLNTKVGLAEWQWYFNDFPRVEDYELYILTPRQLTPHWFHGNG